MNVKERILALKLLEAHKKQGDYMEKIGITVSTIKKQKSKDFCNNNNLN